MMSVDLDAEYDNRTRVPEHGAIFAGWARDAAAYRAVAQRELGTPYGPSVRQVYDLFHPQADGGGPVVIFIHGGYWRAMAIHEFSHLAAGLNGHGHIVALPGYDLCPEVSIADIVGQVQRACLALWHRFRRPLVAVGHSAGGHLAASMLMTDFSRLDRSAPKDLVQAAYALSGLFDLTALRRTRMNADFRLSEMQALALSPAFRPPPVSGSLDAVVGGDESAEFRRQTALIGKRWAGTDFQVRCGEVPGANHFTLLAPLADPGSMMVQRIVDLARRARI